MSSEKWPAPAKLNLFLHVTGRRKDGYHLLQTVFQFLDYGDEIAFEKRDDGQINRIGNYHGIENDQDLIVKAAKLLQQRTDKEAGVDIQIQRRLPMGGGVGGGSSDAATTLVALNEIWQLGISTTELSEIGQGLGADVPVFVHGYAAWAEGIGEQLAPVKLPENWFLVVYPGFGIATAEIFNSPDLTRNTPAITIRDFLAGAGQNDCEAVARKAYPELGKALDWLQEKSASRMTGTGSCIYASFATKDEAKAVLQGLPESWKGFVAKGRNKSPLLDRLDSESPE